jgi:energy-coupling factor transporter transmembrane protein EcfT
LEFLASGGKLISKTMSKVIKILVVLVIVLLLIIVFGNYFLQQQLKQVNEVDFSEIISQIEELSSEQILKPQTEGGGDKKFISPDKKLEIEYSLKWIEAPSESLKRVFANEQIQKYKITNLLWAQRFEISGEFAQLIIDQAFFDIEKSFEQIINEMQKANLEQGWNMRVIKSETKNK